MNKNDRFTMAKNITQAAYRSFLADMRERIDTARSRAVRSVNHELVLLYWDIGAAILEKQRTMGWGDGVVERLSKDLSKHYPGTFGFSPRNLWDMRRFHESWSDPAILRQAVAELGTRRDAFTKGAHPAVSKAVPSRLPARKAFLRQAVAEIPWGHHLVLLNKVQDPAARIWYLWMTAKLGWSRNVLLNQVLGKAHARSLKPAKAHNFTAALSPILAQQAEEALKSAYNLEFLGVAKVLSESDLEQRLIERVREFILELGYGFCFVGQQHRLTLGKKEYFIDLLFYHRFLRSLVAVDLKLNEFEPEHAGKMDFYLNLLNDKERAPDDNPSIGIILCAENDALEVEYSLRSKGNPIGVASYALLQDLPKPLRGKLPSAQQLKAVMAKVLEDVPATEKGTKRGARKRG